MTGWGRRKTDKGAMTPASTGISSNQSLSPNLKDYWQPWINQLHPRLLRRSVVKQFQVAIDSPLRRP